MGVGLANQLMAPAGQATSGVDWSQADQDRPGPAVQPPRRLRRLGPAAAGHEGPDPQSDALRGAQGRQAAAVVDPRPADPHLHRRLLRPRRQRRPEGHGPDHADPDRRGAHRLRPQPHHARHASRRPSSPTAHQAQARVRRPRRARAPVEPPTRRAGPSATPCAPARSTTPPVYGALAVLSADIEPSEVDSYGAMRQVPAAADAEPAQRHVPGRRRPAPARQVEDGPVRHGRRQGASTAFQGKLQAGTRFIPTWVKVAVAIALGLGTMVGWKRIVVTVGERSARPT